MLSTSTPNTRSACVASSAGHRAHSRAVPRFSPDSHEFWPSHPGAPRCNCLDPHPRCTSTEAGLPYSPCLTPWKDRQLTRLSLATRSQLAACTTTSTGAADQLESVVSSVWRRHRRMDPRALRMSTKQRLDDAAGASAGDSMCRHTWASLGADAGVCQ